MVYFNIATIKLYKWTASWKRIKYRHFVKMFFSKWVFESMLQTLWNIHVSLCRRLTSCRTPHWCIIISLHSRLNGSIHITSHTIPERTAARTVLFCCDREKTPVDRSDLSLRRLLNTLIVCKFNVNVSVHSVWRIRKQYVYRLNVSLCVHTTNNTKKFCTKIHYNSFPMHESSI